MSRSGRRTHPALAAIAFAGLLVAGCGLVEPSDATPSSTPTPSFAATFATADGPVALARVNGQLALLAPDGAGGVSEVTRVPDRPGAITVHLAALDGQTGRDASSFVYGRAPVGAASVEVSPEAVTAGVENGLFIVGLRTKDLLPTQFAWRFLAPDRSVVLAGEGIQD